MSLVMFMCALGGMLARSADPSATVVPRTSLLTYADDLTHARIDFDSCRPFLVSPHPEVTHLTLDGLCGELYCVEEREMHGDQGIVKLDNARECFPALRHLVTDQEAPVVDWGWLSVQAVSRLESLVINDLAYLTAILDWHSLTSFGVPVWRMRDVQALTTWLPFPNLVKLKLFTAEDLLAQDWSEYSHWANRVWGDFFASVPDSLRELHIESVIYKSAGRNNAVVNVDTVRQINELAQQHTPEPIEVHVIFVTVHPDAEITHQEKSIGEFVQTSRKPWTPHYEL